MTAESIEVLTNNGVDYDEAMERFGGNAALYERLALKFLNDPHFDALEDALAAGQLDEAYRAAHSLKGVAGNLSFRDLYQAACRASDALHAGDTQAAQAALPDLRASYAAVKEALQQLQR